MAFLIDLSIGLILALAIGAAAMAGFSKAPFYEGAVATMDEIELRSGLYEKEEGGGTVAITESHAVGDDDENPNYSAADTVFATALDQFFADAYFFPEGDGMEIYSALKYGDDAIIYEGSEGNGPYWRREADGTLVPRLSSKAMYSFYVEAIDGTAIPYVSTVSEYIDASRVAFLTVGGCLVFSLFVGLFVPFFVPPLFFRRGRQTLGLKALKLGVLTSEAVPPSLKRTIARNLIFLLVEVLLSIFAFMIPLLVSITMTMARRDRQSFHDYVSGTYVVDASEMPIFLSYDDFVSKAGASTPLDLVEKERILSPEEKESERRGID